MKVVGTAEFFKLDAEITTYLILITSFSIDNFHEGLQVT